MLLQCLGLSLRLTCPKPPDPTFRIRDRYLGLVLGHSISTSPEAVLFCTPFHGTVIPIFYHLIGQVHFLGVNSCPRSFLFFEHHLQSCVRLRDPGSEAEACRLSLSLALFLLRCCTATRLPPSFIGSLAMEPLAYPSDFRPVLRESIRSFIFFELNSDDLPFRLVYRLTNRTLSGPTSLCFRSRSRAKRRPNSWNTLVVVRWVLADATHWSKSRRFRLLGGSSYIR